MRELPPTLATYPEPHPPSQEQHDVFSLLPTTDHKNSGCPTPVLKCCLPCYEYHVLAKRDFQKPTARKLTASVIRLQRCSPVLQGLLSHPAVVFCSEMYSSKQRNTNITTFSPIVFNYTMV